MKFLEILKALWVLYKQWNTAQKEKYNGWKQVYEDKKKDRKRRADLIESVERVGVRGPKDKL